MGEDHIRAISAAKGEPGWLSEYRINSLSVYRDLPLETSPLYTKYTDAKKMDPDQVSLCISSDAGIPPFLQSRMDELQNQNHILQIGTEICNINIAPEAAKAGLVISSVLDALENHPDLIKKALDASDPKQDKFTALNNAAFNGGIFVYVPPDAHIPEPIHLISSLPQDGTSTVSRNIIVADNNSRSSIVQELYSPPSPAQQAYLELLTVSVGPGAHIDGTSLQMLDDSSIMFSTRRADIAADGTMNWYLGLFGSMLSRFRTDYHLNGSGASSNDSEVVFGNGQQSFDLQTNVNHHSPFTEGRVTEKSILRDKSKSLFKGMIRIHENASKSNSYLSGRSILLDKNAKSDAIPGLEIFTNDVKATHSASVAQIDEEQIFYLGTRCLSRSEAERTIVEGFLEPLSRKMSIQVRAWIAYLVESKWEGRKLSINTDEELRKFTEVEQTRYNENAEIEQHYKYR